MFYKKNTKKKSVIKKILLFYHFFHPVTFHNDILVIKIHLFSHNETYMVGIYIIMWLTTNLNIHYEHFHFDFLCWYLHIIL